MEQKINLIDLINEINNNTMYEADKMKNNPISELHMHKILFILYGKFYDKFSKDLFNTNFEAWKYGPVEIDYRNNLLDKFNINLNKDEINYIEHLIKKLVKSNPWLLVEFTHDLLSWIKNYDERSIHNKIPNDDIKKNFEKMGYFD